MQSSDCIQVYHRTPILLDNVLEYENPQFVSSNFDPSLTISSRKYPRSKFLGHVIYYVSQDQGFPENNFFEDSSYTGDALSQDDPKFSFYKQHLESPKHAGIWVQPTTNDSARQGIHWRIINKGCTLELRRIKFASKINKDDISNISPKDFMLNDTIDLSKTDVSPILSLVFSDPLEGKVEFFQEAVPTNLQSQHNELILWALTANSKLFRISFKNISDIGIKDSVNDITVNFYKIMSKSSFDTTNSSPFTNNNTAYSKHNSIANTSKSVPSFKQIRAINAFSALVFWKDGLVALIAGTECSNKFSFKKSTELKFNFIKQSKRFFTSQLYKQSTKLDDINHLLEFVVLPKNISASQPESLVFGLESNKTLWVWNLHSANQKEKTQINLPSLGPDSNSFIKSDQTAFICDFVDYSSICSSLNSDSIENNNNPSHKRRIALIVYIPDGQASYFALLEGIIDLLNFSSSVLQVSGIKKITSIFDSVSSSSNLIDLKISSGKFDPQYSTYNWQIYSLWKDGSKDTVMYGFVETLPSSFIADSSSDFNIDPENMAFEPLLKWGKASSIGERWVPSYPLIDQLCPQPTHGELELLHEWLVSKKSNTEFINSLLYSLDQELELHIGDNLKDKLTSKIHSTMIDFVMNPVHYSSSVIQYALEIYKSKFNLNKKNIDRNDQDQSLRLILINTIGTNILYNEKSNQKGYSFNSKSDSDFNDNQLDLQRIYEYGYQLYTEWMWFLQITTQAQIEHYSAFQLFIDPEIDLVGVTRSLSFETLNSAADFDWIIEKTKPSTSYFHANNSINLKEHNQASILSATSFLLLCPSNLLDPDFYYLLNSSERNKILIFCRAANILCSNLSLLTKAQLVNGINLLFKGGTYLDIERELSKLFKEVFTNNTEMLSVSLTKAIQLLFKAQNISSVVLSLLEMLIEIKTENQLHENNYNSEQHTTIFKNSDISNYAQIFELIDPKSKSKIFAKAIDTFRFYSFCKKFSQSTTIGAGKTKSKSVLNLIHNSKFDYGIEYTDLQKKSKLVKLKHDSNDSRPYTSLNILDNAPELTSYNLLHSSILEWQASILDGKHNQLEKTEKLLTNSSDHKILNLTLEFISEKILEYSSTNQIESITSVPDKVESEAKSGDFYLSISKLVKLCAIDILDPNQILVLLDALPTVFHVAFLSGLAFIQLGKFINASDCFLSAASIVFSLEDFGISDTQSNSTEYVQFLSKFNSWLGDFGIFDTNPAVYYLRIANIFESVKSHHIACDFYSLALEKLGYDKTKGNNIDSSSLEITEKADFDVGSIQSKLFHSAIESSQIDLAYLSVLNNPDIDISLECLRIFVNTCLDKNNINWCRLLVTLPFPGLLGEVERCLLFKARNSKLNTDFLFKIGTPLNNENEGDVAINYYHVIFSFYIRWNNYREAASIMYQYSQRLYKLYKPPIVESDSIKSVKAYQKWLDLQLESLLMSIQTLEMEEEEKRFILVRKLVMQPQPDEIESGAYKRKVDQYFINLNNLAELNTEKGQENSFIIDLDEIKHSYEQIKANQHLLNTIISNEYIKEEDYLAFLEINMNPNSIINSYFELGLLEECIELAVKLEADYNLVVSEFARLLFKSDQVAVIDGGNNTGEINFIKKVDDSHEKHLKYLKRAINIFESNLRAKNSGENEIILLKLHTVQEILTHYNEKISNSEGHAEITVSSILPSWLTQPLFESRPIDLIMTCVRNKSILDASNFLVLLIKQKTTELQDNTQLSKHFNTAYMPYNLIAEIKSSISLVISKLAETKSLISVKNVSDNLAVDKSKKREKRKKSKALSATKNNSQKPKLVQLE
ncbi:hypothetical protein BB561_001038 [Smittium simulii]|uniref:NUP160 middle TPR domain-containing protein n=1 Tax=Smittium simulii TaxID=133385 RepID=A0A2T9YWE7_9FUNG|nr:hypothetical protein BB561_001038 [Smittium simulii]